MHACIIHGRTLMTTPRLWQVSHSLPYGNEDGRLLYKNTHLLIVDEFVMRNKGYKCGI